MKPYSTTGYRICIRPYGTFSPCCLHLKIRIVVGIYKWIEEAANTSHQTLHLHIGINALAVLETQTAQAQRLSFKQASAQQMQQTNGKMVGTTSRGSRCILTQHLAATLLYHPVENLPGLFVTQTLQILPSVKIGHQWRSCLGVPRGITGMYLSYG